MKLNMHVCRLQRMFSNAPYIRYVKCRQRVNLTEMHRNIRVNWAREKLHLTAVDWKIIIFTDEKKYPLDGSDGL